MPQTVGSRAQVMHGTAKKTSGGLTKSQLKYNKQGKIVSKKASTLAKKNNRLVKAGYVTRKGEFGVSMRGGFEAYFADYLKRIRQCSESTTYCEKKIIDNQYACKHPKGNTNRCVPRSRPSVVPKQPTELCSHTSKSDCEGVQYPGTDLYVCKRPKNNPNSCVPRKNP